VGGGRIILEWILRKGVGKLWTGLDSSGSGLEPVAASCGYGNGPSGCIKGVEFLD
jgi:hypothetical protein